MDTKRIRFMNNIMIYKRLEVHDVPVAEADVYIRNGWAIEVVPEIIKEIELVEPDEDFEFANRFDEEFLENAESQIDTEETED
jgi:hypothetical protein